LSWLELVIMERRTFEEQLDGIHRQASAALETVTTLAELAEWERAFVGSKGSLTSMFRQMGLLEAADRPGAGRRINQVKLELTAAFAAREERLASRATESRLASEAVDVTLPGRVSVVGNAHPVSLMIDELSEIFGLMGFQTVFGPEVETGRYNFDLLNIPSDHPARDVWDTIIIDAPTEEMMLRTHTSPMQARVMEKTKPPVRVIVPGRVYRYEAQDASHEWMFHQIEGLCVDSHIRMSDLKGVLQELARQLFGPTRRIRFRCDFFPFVEPGVDFAVDCAICDGKGCRVCKQSGWLEMGGAGMVHPKVLAGVGIDPEVYTGFAFGLGVERLLMMRYGISDIRAFAGNDLRFLSDFAALAV